MLSIPESLTLFGEVIAVSSLLVYWASSSRSVLFQRVLHVLACLGPALLAAFRGSGTDTSTYYQLYLNFDSTSILSIFRGHEIEPLNQVALLLAHQADSFTVYLLIFSALTTWLALSAIRGLASPTSYPYAWFLFLCIYYPASHNIMRQMLAASAVLWAFRHILSHRRLQSIIWLTIAFSFHTTAILALPIFFLLTRKSQLRKWLFGLLVAGSLSLFVFLGSALSWFSDFTGEDRYLGYSQYVNPTANRSIILSVFVLIVAMVALKRLRIHLPMAPLYAMVLAVGVCLEVIGYVSPFLKRVAIYYELIQVVLLGSLPLVSRSEPSRAFVKTCVISWGVVYFLVMYGLTGQAGVIPYAFVLK